MYIVYIISGKYTYLLTTYPSFYLLDYDNFLVSSAKVKRKTTSLSPYKTQNVYEVVSSHHQ